MQHEKDLVRKEIISNLDKFDLKDSIEVLANVFISLGTQFMDVETIETKNVTKCVLDDIERNGETLPNALTRQGLIILTWLSKE
jgi:hypothetical protein